MPTTDDALRGAVAGAARRLARAGLVAGTAGNVSARAGDRIAVTPTGARLDRLTAGAVAIVDRDGTQKAGALEPTSELALHLGVYAAYDAGAVVHAHAPVATALSTALDELPAIHYDMLALGGAIRTAPYATFGTPELADGVVRALEGRAAALMANHGAIALGADAAAALRAMEILEWCATLWWRAAQVGTPRALSDADLAAVAGEVARRGYGATRAAAAPAHL